MIYEFLITLKDQMSNQRVTLKVDSVSDNYLTAWKSITETAWGELNDHDKTWYIESIKHCL